MSEATPVEESHKLEDLKDAIGGGDGGADGQEPAAPAEPKIDEQGRSYATGKRKDAVARVWLKPGVRPASCR